MKEDEIKAKEVQALEKEKEREEEARKEKTLFGQLKKLLFSKQRF